MTSCCFISSLTSFAFIKSRTQRLSVPPLEYLLPIANTHGSLGTHDSPLPRARHPIVPYVEKSDKRLQILNVCLHGNRDLSIGMFLILPSAVIEFLSFHRTESNEFVPVSIRTNHPQFPTCHHMRQITPLSTPAEEFNVKRPRRIRCFVNTT